MKNYLETFGAIFVGIIIMLVSALITGAIVMLFWNWLMPAIFGLGVITYWQGWGISFLSALLFKGNVKVESQK